MTRKRKNKNAKPKLGTAPAEQLSKDVPAKHRTWFDDVIDEHGMLEGCIMLEPRDALDEAIVGWDMDGNHVIYSYEKLIAAYYKQFDDELDEDQRMEQAVEWVDYNVVRGVGYMGERRPVIISTGNIE